MLSPSFDPDQLALLYKKLDLECDEYAREHGYVTAVQRNLIAARLMEAARSNPPAPVDRREPSAQAPALTVAHPAT